MRRFFLLFVPAISVFAVAAPARSESITYSDLASLQATGWSQDLLLPQFDPALGVLQTAVLTLSGHIEGTSAFESMDTQSATVNLLFAADLTVSGPTLSALLVASPQVLLQAFPDPFDGTIDFGGGSGRSYADLSADDVVTMNLLDSFTSLAQYTGTGSVLFAVQSAGDSHGSGSGNLLLNFQQNSSALVEVTYGFGVPEPATLALLGIGLSLVARRRTTG